MVPPASSARRPAGASALAVIAVLVAGCSNSTKAAGGPASPYGLALADRVGEPDRLADTRRSAGRLPCGSRGLRRHPGRRHGRGQLHPERHRPAAEPSRRLHRRRARRSSVERFVASHFGLRGQTRVVSWRPVELLPADGQTDRASPRPPASTPPGRVLRRPHRQGAAAACPVTSAYQCRASPSWTAGCGRSSTPSPTSPRHAEPASRDAPGAEVLPRCARWPGTASVAARPRAGWGWRAL